MTDTAAPMPEPQDIAALRDALTAAAGTCICSEDALNAVGCSCHAEERREYLGTYNPWAAPLGGTSPMPALLSEVERGRALRAAVEALRDEMAGDDCECETFWSRRLTVLLAAHVPSPLPVGGAAGAGEGP